MHIQSRCGGCILEEERRFSTHPGGNDIFSKVISTMKYLHLLFICIYYRLIIMLNLFLYLFVVGVMYVIDGILKMLMFAICFLEFMSCHYLYILSRYFSTILEKISLMASSSSTFHPKVDMSEMPKKFSRQHFKRWQQRMRILFTMIELISVIESDCPMVVENDSESDKKATEWKERDRLDMGTFLLHCQMSSLMSMALLHS